MNFYLLLAISYLLGSIPFGKIVGRFHGIDIQKEGSGNIGFANSLRVMGWKPALLVLVGDVLKGFIPASLAVRNFDHTFFALIICATAIVGHIFPLWLKFKGGKGVATIVGITFALSPLLGTLAVLLWTIIFLITKLAAIASLSIAVFLPIVTLYFDRRLTYFYLILLVVIFLTHRTNIKNLRTNCVKEL